MEFSWTTFALEIVNFLALVWILERLLYRPVLRVIEERRAAVEGTLAGARAVQAEAEQLKRNYEDRMRDWAEERERARETLAAELAAERARRAQAIETSLEADRIRREAVGRAREAEARREAEAAARSEGLGFASRLLARLAGPELEAKVLDAALEDLSALPPERIDALRRAGINAGHRVEVASGHELSPAERERCARALASVFGKVPEIVYREDATLLAGVRVAIGPWLLCANLRDELDYFAGGPEHVR